MDRRPSHLTRDRDDWAEESSKMSQIYRSAHATIAAASSKSCRESFLAVSRQESMVIKSETIDGKPADLRVKNSLRSGIHYFAGLQRLGGHLELSGHKAQDRSSGRVDPLIREAGRCKSVSSRQGG